MDDKIKAYVKNNIQKTAQTYKKIGQQYVNNAKFTFDVGREVAKAPAFLGKTAATGLIKIPTQVATNGRVDLAKNKYIGKAFMTDKQINQVSATPTAPLKFLGQNVLAGAKTAATAFGAPAMATRQGLTSLGASSLLGGGLNKAMGQDARQGAVQGAALAPTIAGITRYSNPLIEQGVAKFAPRIAGKMPNIIKEGIARVPGNVIEGAAIDATLGRRPLSLGSAAIDAATAFIPGDPNLRKQDVPLSKIKGVSSSAYKLPEHVIDRLYQVIEPVYMREHPVEAKRYLQDFLEAHAPGYKNVTTDKAIKLAQAILDRNAGLRKEFQTPYPKMGIVEDVKVGKNDVAQPPIDDLGTYYIRNGANELVKAENAKPINLGNNVEAFSHRFGKDTGVVISEAKTGMQIATGKTEKEAIANAQKAFKDLRGITPQQLIERQLKSLVRVGESDPKLTSVPSSEMSPDLLSRKIIPQKSGIIKETDGGIGRRIVGDLNTDKEAIPHKEVNRFGSRRIMQGANPSSVKSRLSQERAKIDQLSGDGALPLGGSNYPSSPLPQGKPPVTDIMGKIKSTPKDQRGFLKIGAEVGGGKPKVSAKSSSEGIIPQGFTATNQLTKNLESVANAKEFNQTAAETSMDLRGSFSTDDIKYINRTKAIFNSKAFRSGDIETLRRTGNGDTVNKTLENVMERRPEITTEQEAIDFIQNFPTQSSTKMKRSTLSPEDKVLRVQALKEQAAFEKEFGALATPKDQLKSLSEWDKNYMKQFEGQSYGATPKTQEKVKLRNFDAEGRSARQDYEEWSRAVKQQEAPRTTTGAMNTATKAMKTNTVSPAARDVSGYKDISGFSGQARDVYRNFKQVFGNKYADVKRTVLDPFDSSKGKFTRNLDNWADQLDTNIVKKYGFNKGSRESAAIQQYGEGTKDFRQLVEEFGDAKAKNIVEADKWFRQQYDSLLGEVNATRAKIYPNDPEKIIPRRSDYYRHFKEMQEGFSGLVNIFDTPANIQSGLSGISASTKPKSKWLSFAQKRLGGESDIDAVGGFINYVKAAEYAKNIDPHISRFRALREELAQATDIGTPQAGKLNNFLEFLDNYANDLSGKTSTADRFIQTVIPGGRKTMSVINWANNRVKANVILGNASSSMAQIMNVPSGVASAGPIASTKGLGRTVASIFDDNKIIKQSDFIAERYSGGTFDRFDKGMVKNTKKMAAWMIQVLDEVGTKYIWNSHYEKALSEGVPNPVKYADDFTREMVAGRGIGEVPLIQKSKVFQLVAPFQLEVGNLWHVMGDMVGEKQFGKLATLFVSSYILNRGIEKVRGSDVSFDPINASIEAYQTYMEEEEKGKAAIQAGGRMAGEVLSNIPFGQSVAAMYPEYGFKVGESQAPTREDLFGKGDPTRYGSGLLLTKGVQDPFFKLLPPFGGQQLKRTIEGIKSVGQGYAGSASGKVQYPIEKNVRNFLQAGIFGKYSIPEAQDYFNENRSVLGDKQSETFKNAQDPNAVYDKVMADRASKKDTSSSTINFEDEAKLRLEEGSGVAYAPGKIYYKDINGDVKSINTGSVTGLSEDNKYLKAIKNSKAFTIADDIIESNLPDEVKNQALSDIGIDRDDAEYYSIASQSNDLRSIYLLEVAQAFVNKSGNRQDMIDLLVSQRQKVNGKMIASDEVLDNLYNDGYITKEERKALKDIDFDSEGKLKVKPASGGKKAKVIKPPVYKLSRKKRLQLKKPKIASIKLEGSKKLKTTKPKTFAPIKLVNSKK